MASPRCSRPHDSSKHYSFTGQPCAQDPRLTASKKITDACLVPLTRYEATLAGQCEFDG